MRILISGGTGFIGSNLVRRLLNHDIPVLMLVRAANFVDKNKEFQIAPVLQWDDTDNAKVMEAVATFKPTTAVHLAWNGTTSNVRDEESLVIKNLKTTMAFLDLARLSGCNRFIGFGSQAEYTESQKPLQEDMLTIPNSNYGIAKLAAYLLAQNFCQKSQMDFLWLRIFALYGVGQQASYIVPQTIQKLLRGEKLDIRSPNASWDFLHISDLVDAVQIALNQTKLHGIYNLSSGKGTQISEIVDILRTVINTSAENNLGILPSEKICRIGNPHKFMVNAGWKPKIELKDGLRQIVSEIEVGQGCKK